ncbi:amino acid ABC transporter substrate-binding protein [Mycetocola reblochoni]|uniref:L-Cystine ABC transporter, periplasmic cystine-binding protein TcyA n=2 Tax=Mycetocola reblochoni TaxID=331618 RepID=A0A1R4J3U0_9MICO|nr:amino acid ABC transporter substrate-binding protein [Mycetocola reblochoni]RLP69484.1 amino acid ABC transporter substrate-binding protein [Mycetocola reblochoni]SJN26445.1 L-Cystine ABC transporter, periplasmic cystine-binding protein TcyA [Mycetocola reblochoni REB411]
MSRLRRALIVPVVLGSLLGLAACSGQSDDAATPAGGLTLEQITEAGVLRVGTEGTYRPFSFHEDGSGDLTGYDVEVITAVAEKLGVTAEFDETQWDALFAALDAGRIDVIANQVSINDEREAKYTLSTPYSVSPGVLVVADGTDDISGFDDIEGKTLAQSLTSNWYTLAESYGATVEGVEGWAQAAELLSQGRVDATINDKLTVLDDQKNSGDRGLRIVAESDEPSRSALAFPGGSEELVAAVDDALAELRADGVLAELGEKYFGEDVSE